MNERMRSVLQGILAQFESGDVPMMVIKAMFPFSNIQVKNGPSATGS